MLSNILARCKRKVGVGFMKKTTNTLTSILKKTKPENLEAFFEKNAEDVLEQENAFASYMRGCVREKGLRFQEIFLRADI